MRLDMSGSNNFQGKDLKNKQMTKGETIFKEEIN
jgi:hypothetical protein